MSAGRESEWKTDFVDQLNGAIRDNPLAAGLVGAGVAWMLLGGTKGLGMAARGAMTVGGAAASGASSVASRTAGAVSAGLSSAKSGMAAAAQGASDTTADLAGAVASIVPDLSMPDSGKAYDAVAEAGSAVRGRLNSAAASGREYGSVLQSRLADTLERQPMLLGALGLAIGAGIASTFASTKIEERLVGEKADAAREALHELAGEATGRAQQAMADVREELTSQGLTAERAKAAAGDLAAKAKNVATAGKDSVAKGFSSSQQGRS